jgi:hypothetical protein
VLEEEGVYGDMTIGSLDLGLIPLDEDLLSMENPDIYREVCISVISKAPGDE